MAKTTRSVPVTGVAAGSTAVIDVPIGLSLHGLILTRGGTFTHDNMEEIRVIANGREIMRMTGAHLDDIQQYNGLAVATSTLSYIDFERLGLKTRNAVELTAIGTGMPQNLDPNHPNYNPVPITTLQVEIDIAAGAVSPTLAAKAIQSGPSAVGTIIKRRKFTYSPAGSGDFEISDLPRGDRIDKIYVHHSNMTALKLERDNFRVFDRTDGENDLIQADGVRTPIAAMFVLDPSERGNGGESLVSIANDLRLIATMSGADTLTIHVDYLGGLQGN